MRIYLPKTRCFLLFKSCILILVLLINPQQGQAQNLDLKFLDSAPSPYGVWGVHTSRSLSHLGFFAAINSNYANDLLLTRQSNSVVNRQIQHRFTSELAVSLGLLNWGEISFVLPVYWRQISQNYAPFSDDVTGLGDMRILGKVSLLKNKKFKGFGLALLLEFSFPTGRKNRLMSQGGVSFTPRLVLDYRHKNGLVVALNLGYRIRGQEKFLDLVMDDEIRLALAAEIPLFYQGLFLLGEVDTAIATHQFSGKAVRDFAYDTPVELRLGLRWRHDSGVMVSFGTGIGLTPGYSVPDVRVMLSVGWSYPSTWKKPPTKKQLYARDGSSPQGRDLIARRPPARRVEKDPTTARVPPKVRKKKSEDVPPPPVARAAKVSAKAFDRTVANDPDADGDGIPVPLDQCPKQREDFDKFEDSDGCPDPDNDRDGIPDGQDKCPRQRETINGIDDNDGCPDEGKGKISLMGQNIKINEKIFFKSGSDQLEAKSMSILRQLALFLKSQWQVRLVQIEGHTDNRGNSEMNVDLSERRAQRVRSELIRLGVASVRLKSRGYGPKQPIASNRNSKGRAKNRRVAFKILRVYVPSQRKGGQK